MMVIPKIGQRYLFEGPDTIGAHCSIVYEIVDVALDQKLPENERWNSLVVRIKLLQVKQGGPSHCYTLYETDKIVDLINDKCSFTYLEGQDKPYVQ